MKHIALSAVLAVIYALSATAAHARTVHTLRGEPFTVDTLRHYAIGPGILYTQLRYQSLESEARHFTSNVIDFEMSQAIDAGIRDYTLTCDPSVGQVSSDGRSVRFTGAGVHPLTVTTGEQTATLAVTVAE